MALGQKNNGMPRGAPTDAEALTNAQEGFKKQQEHYEAKLEKQQTESSELLANERLAHDGQLKEMEKRLTAQLQDRENQIATLTAAKDALQREHDAIAAKRLAAKTALE
jgi:hypothetical protein